MRLRARPRSGPPRAPGTGAARALRLRGPLLPFRHYRPLPNLPAPGRDAMTRGRAMFGAGPGALPSDSQMFGLRPADLRTRMEEALDAIMPLLRGETVSMKTEWFELVEARLGVGCYSKPTIETAVTSVR